MEFFSQGTFFIYNKSHIKIISKLRLHFKIGKLTLSDWKFAWALTWQISVSSLKILIYSVKYFFGFFIGINN